MKTKLLVCMSMLWLLCNNQLDAQHKMVKLSNYDPSAYRYDSNTPAHPWAYSNIWGDVITDKSDNTQREYAFIGVSGWSWLNTNKGVSIVDVTDPLNPYEAAFITCPAVDQRDFVTYTDPNTNNTYLYIIGEGNNQGMIIVDITNLPSSYSIISSSYFTGNYNAVNSSHAHNVQLDEVTGKMIVCGTHSGAFSAYTMYMFDVASNPAAPVLIDVQSTGVNNAYYVHDVYFNNDRLYTASIEADPDGSGPIPPPTYAGIFQTSNSSNYFDLIGGVTPYPVDQTPSIPLTSLNHVIHDIYVTSDHSIMVTSDEHQQGQAIFYDITNPASPIETDRYSGHKTTFVDTVAQHNHVMKGIDRCYVAHYSNGLWVLDISDPYNVQEIAYYDTYLEHNYGNYDTYNKQFRPPYGTGYYGAWGVFADLPSGNILVCDMNNGLYVLSNCVPEDNQSGANLTLNAASYANEVFGRAATTSITVNPGSGNFIVGTDANVTLIAGSKISLKPGFHAQADGKFHAQIAYMCQNCDECPDSPPGISHPKPGGQQQVATSDKMKCYPNPASTHLNLQVSLVTSGHVSVVVYDQFGRNVINVLEDAITDSGMMQKTIDISALPAGIYTVKLKTAAGTQTTRFTKI